jgi:hypothetical protein
MALKRSPEDPGGPCLAMAGNLALVGLNFKNLAYPDASAKNQRYRREFRH